MGEVEILLREVRPADLEELCWLAERLNTLNLPADRAKLKKIIEHSRGSFGGRFQNPSDRQFVFVLRDLGADRVIGTCMIFAQHGTYRRPAVYFNVREDQKYSPSLERHFRHTVLELNFNYDGPTEIGGLILDPAYRGSALKLGKLLSYVRFLYIGMHREWFRDQIVAELLPPLNDDGTSDLWNHLGAKFTGLDYTTADRRSRDDVDFIRNLFPTTPIYATLLPDYVRAQIGKVGIATKPVARMLRSIGFRYDNSIDPFDGGPTYRAPTDACEPVRRTHWSTFAGWMDQEEPEGLALVGFEYESHMVRFRSIFAHYHTTPQGVMLRPHHAHRLNIEPGQTMAVLPMTGPGMQRLY